MGSPLAIARRWGDEEGVGTPQALATTGGTPAAKNPRPRTVDPQPGLACLHPTTEVVAVVVDPDGTGTVARRLSLHGDTTIGMTHRRCPCPLATHLHLWRGRASRFDWRRGGQRVWGVDLTCFLPTPAPIGSRTTRLPCLIVAALPLAAAGDGTVPHPPPVAAPQLVA